MSNVLLSFEFVCIIEFIDIFEFVWLYIIVWNVLSSFELLFSILHSSNFTGYNNSSNSTGIGIPVECSQRKKVKKKNASQRITLKHFAAEFFEKCLVSSNFFINSKPKYGQCQRQFR